jgi:hypothetical protein
MARYLRGFWMREGKTSRVCRRLKDMHACLPGSGGGSLIQQGDWTSPQDIGTRVVRQMTRCYQSWFRSESSATSESPFGMTTRLTEINNILQTEFDINVQLRGTPTRGTNPALRMKLETCPRTIAV